MAPSSYKDYTGDGSTTTFSITFDYQKESEISVTVDGVAQSGFTFPSSTQVQLTTAPASNTLVRVRRTTDLSSREVDFASGSVLTEEDLDNSNIQVFHAAQEAIDTANDAISLDDDDKFDAQSKVIKNVANPVNAQDAATKDYLENTWLTEADKTQLNALDTDNLDLVADDVANVNTVATNIADVNTVAARDADIDTVAARDTDIGTVASRDADIGTVADRDADIGTVADRDADIGTVAARDADIGTVADDLDLASPKITTVANNIANVNTVAGVSSDVTTVAGISADVSAVEDIAANVTTVAGIDSDVTTVAGISADVTTVADNDANVTTVAGNNANITTVAGVSSDVTTVAGISANVTTVANDGTDIGTVAGISSNVTTVAGISSDVTTVAGVAADVTTAATNIADITAVADEVNKVISVANDLAEATSEIDVVAGSIANVDAVGGSIANVNTVASNISDVNNFADTYAISATAPSSPTVGDLWFDTTNNVMKVYSSGGFINAGSAVNGTANRVSFVVGTSEGSYDGSTTVFPIEYDSGYIDVYLNGVKLTEDDFTATNGTSVTLDDAATTGDTFEAVGYGTFELSNFSIGDANNVDLTGLADDQFLQYNSTSGNFEPATVATDVSGDSTPQLGGDLDAQTNDITNVGKLGIGTSSPSDALVVDGGTLGGTTYATITNNHSDQFISMGINGNVGEIAVDDGDVMTFGHYDNSTNKTYTERMRINSSGNVGLGETNPSKKLVISENDAEAAMIIKSSDTGTAALYFGDQSDEIIGGISYDNTNDLLQLRSSNNNVAVSIDSGERVGVGTSSPSTYDSRANNLVVGDSGDSGITIFSGSSSEGRLVFAQSGDTGLSNGAIHYDQSNDVMSFDTGGSSRMQIKGDGSWGKAPAGTIMQVKQTQVTSLGSVSLPAQTWVNYPSLTVTITPKSTSSKILIRVNAWGEITSNGQDTVFAVKRNSTVLSRANEGNRTGGLSTPLIVYHGDDNSTAELGTFEYLDSPASTSSLTYQVILKAANAKTYYYNRTVGHANDQYREVHLSTITVMEVA